MAGVGEELLLMGELLVLQRKDTVIKQTVSVMHKGMVTMVTNALNWQIEA